MTFDENRATADQLLREAARIAALAAERDTQLTAADAERMTPDEIVAAKRQGRFDNLLRGETP